MSIWNLIEVYYNVVFFLYNKFQLYCLKMNNWSVSQKILCMFSFLKVVTYSIQLSFLFYFMYIVYCSVRVRKQSFKTYVLKPFTTCVCMTKNRHLYHFILYHDFILVSMISSLPNILVVMYASKSGLWSLECISLMEVENFKRLY